MAFRKSFALIQLLFLLLPTKVCGANESHDCPPSSCGSIRKISHPFQLKDDPNNCGDPRYELGCENNQTTLYLNSKRFLVLSISYRDFTVRLVDPGLAKYQGYSSCPLHSLTLYDLYSNGSYINTLIYHNPNKMLIYVSCSSPLNSSRYYDSTFCGDSPSSAAQSHSYAILHDNLMRLNEIEASCSVKRVALVSKKAPEVGNTQFSNYSYGFDLLWSDIYCVIWRPSTIRPTSQCLKHVWSSIEIFFIPLLHFLWVYCQHHYNITLVLPGAIILGPRVLLGILCLLTLLVLKIRRKHLSMYETIEKFLQGQHNLVPIRYSYREVKKMTKNFRDKLGEGGYGTVFKGKLRSGLLVAVKMLGKSKASGEEFISEVATIGRIHHVNVVNLIGFCFEGSKRALIYEFMPNGSLDKYIFPQEGETKSSNWEKMFQISLGVAQGMDYLHRGCEMQILHFDIKPHNILLDENFNPKISDFGLAKLYPADESIVSLTAARGTMGYMAPELFYKNIGRISYKADVYSFGMLLMEMAGKRKNLNPFVDHLSQIYFPSWVHDQFSQGKEIEMGDATEDERKLVKKMILVALWCIQMKPTDRPSMNKVVEMLEGDLELLEMPAKPFLSPEGMQDDHQDQEIHRNNAELPLLSNGNRDSSSLNVAI